MEYVDGVNLRGRSSRDGQLKPEEAIRIVPQICEALQFAHEEGIVHRDIKPEDILIDKKGRVKIADFGLAKLLGRAPEDLSLTGTGQLMGTLGYMAPEQLQQAHTVDHRADILSLGVVFYEMLTGKLPIGRFEPPSKKVQLDVRLDEIVLHALENEPDRRYQHASDVKTDVEMFNEVKAGFAEKRCDRQQGDPFRDEPHRDDVSIGRARLRAPADALFLHASLASATAFAVALWLGVVRDRPHLAPAIERMLPEWARWEATILTLWQMSAVNLVYGAIVGAGALLMRRLRAHMLVVSSVVVAGIALPSVLAFNVITEWGTIPQWPILIPTWLGRPVAVGAASGLLQPKVGAAF